MTNYELKNKLQAIADTRGISIEKEVALEALDNYPEELEVCFSNILNYGCITGIVGSLIYYTDTHAFFDTHYDQIEELRCEYEENTGMPINIKGDLKNDLAWFAFEHVAYTMANELGLEI